MAVYWHPFLSQFMRDDYGDRLDIKDSVKLGEMPLEMDLLIKPLVPVDELPYPFNHLGVTTIADLKGPEDTAIWDDLAQIEGYACLYQRRKGIRIRDRSKITLWLIASKFSRTFNQPPENYIDNLTPLGEGVSKGEIAKFPIYIIDLETLPITLGAFPLLMVYKGNLEREKEIAAFFVEHYQELKRYTRFISTIHAEALEEVSKTMDLSSLQGFDLNLPAIIRLFGTRKVLDTLGEEEVVDTMGLDRIIETAGRERILEEMFPNLSKEQIKKLIEQNGSGGKVTESD